MNRTIKTSLLALMGSLAAAPALAQSPQPAPAPLVAPPPENVEGQAAPDTETGTAPEQESTLVPEPPPPPPPPPPPAAAPLFRFYGFIKPTVIYGNGLESFGNPNFTAITAAANPASLPNPDATALSFQAQQTRIGVAIGEGTPVKGVVEFDFIDFAKSSPAQSTTPRIRQAYVEWTPKETHKLVLGQLWDMFSPLNTHSYNLVGTLFQSGNSGFMRHQLMYYKTMGNFELGGALGLITQNLTPPLSTVEYNRWPTITLRGSYKVDKKMWVGASAIFTRLRFNPNTPTEEQSIAVGGNLFADLTFGAINLRAEAYAGQNLNNLGLLVLGQGSAAADVPEAGGFLSAKFTLSEQNAFHLIAGAAAVLDTDDMAVGYTGAKATGDFARVGGNGPGIETNFNLRAGYAYIAFKGFSLVAEPFFILTKHKLATADAAIEDDSRKGYGIEAGAMYSF